MKEKDLGEEEENQSSEGSNPYLLTIKLRALYSAGDFEQALELVEEGLQEYPEEAVLYNEKGYILNELGDFEGARENLEKAVGLDDQLEEEYSNLAFALIDLEEYEEEMEAVTKAIELKPDAPEQYVALGNALVMLDRDEEALEYFDKALEIDPKLDYALYGKGGALFYLEEYEESITYLETYLELEPTDVDVLDALVYAYEMTGDYEETIKYNDIVIEIDEDENLIYNIDYKGILLTENGQLDEAEQLYEKMLEEHPLEKGIAYYGLSFIHIYRGEIDEGLDQLEDAAAEDPNLIDYAASDPMFEEVYDNERFIELVGADEDSFNGL